MLRFYVEVARTAFRRHLVYRWANLAGFCTNFFFVSIISYLIIALYRARSSAAGYDVHDTLRYIWLMQSMVMVIAPFSWQELMLTVRSGEFISDLSKPCDFYWYWFSREMGSSVYYLLFRGLPVYCAGILLFGIGIPGEWQNWLAYAGVLSVAMMLGVAYRLLYNVFAFWLLEGRAVATLANTIALFFSGSFVPFPFYPVWLRNLAIWLPFNGLLNLPTETFIGKFASHNMWLEVSTQIAWLLILTLFVRKLISIAARRVVVQGG